MNNYYITPEDYARAEKNGISKTTLESRVRCSGWNIEKAITKPVTKRQPVPQELIQEGLKRGLSKQCILTRFYKGLSPAECIAPSKVKRILKSDWIRRAKNNGVCYDTLRYRILEGWDVEKAITTPPLNFYERSKLAVLGRNKRRECQI